MAIYNPNLDTFIKVAETGSFSKAAEQLFISPTAIVKKINTMESHLGVKLFMRTHHGVSLTPAGESLYADAKYIIKYSELAVARARESSNSESNIIRIGKSLNTPCDILENIWPQVMVFDPELKLSIVPFDNSTESVDNMFCNLGIDMDAYVGLIDPVMLNFRKCMALRLTWEPLKIAVAPGHRLYGKKKIRIRDLYGERLMLVQQGRFAYYDELRRELTENHPQIGICDWETVNIDAFNACIQTGSPIVIIEPWKKMHPLFNTISVAWEHVVPWGVVYAHNPSAHLRKFLGYMEKIFDLTEADYYR